MDAHLPSEIAASISLCCSSSPGFPLFTCTVRLQTLIFPVVSALSSGPAHSRRSLGFVFLSSADSHLLCRHPQALNSSQRRRTGYLVGLDSKKQLALNAFQMLKDARESYGAQRSPSPAFPTETEVGVNFNCSDEL